MKTIITTISFLLLIATSYAQQSAIDSLLTLIKKDKEDTNKVNHLNNLSREYLSSGSGSYDSLLYYGKTALSTSQHLNFKRGSCTAYNIIGSVNYRQGDLLEALDNFRKSLRIAEELKDKTKMASCIGNIGNVYFDQGNFPKAIDNYLKALKLGEELEDKDIVASNLGNIGNVYFFQKDFSKTLHYYFKALKIAEEQADKFTTSVNLINIGIVYGEEAKLGQSQSMKDSLFNKSLHYFLKALKIAEELEANRLIAGALSNIGGVYDAQNNYGKALEYYFKALKITEEMGAKDHIANVLGNIGIVYTKQKKYTDAYNYLYKALALSDSIRLVEYVKNWYEKLSILYEISNKSLPDSIGGKLLNMEGMRLRSLYYHKRYIALRDTIFSVENSKQLVRKEMNFEFDKKELVMKSEQEKERAVSEVRNRKQKIVIGLVVGGLLLVIVFAGFIFRSLRVTRKQKRIIELQKGEVERQKELVEIHQKEIIDSITYAKRLQEAILPPTTYVNEHLPLNFILYKPKDIIAGDFYWMEVVDDIIFIASADSTGHGVPGAMVSVVCSNALNRTVKEFHLRETGQILDKVTDLVLETFEKSDKDVKDGMDISLLAINKTTKQIQWSGANNPLWYIQNGELLDITANKQPIGKHDNRRPFTAHDIPFQPNTTFYLFTDGMPDQFGGPKGKKFKYKQLEEVLLANSLLSMAEQKATLDRIFEEWKGNLEQVDDVCILGIRV